MTDNAVITGGTAVKAPKSPLRKAFGLIRGQPLFLAQIFTSAAGAGAMVMAAAAMPAEEFVRFSLLTLITVTLVGAVRAVLFQPALIEMRQNNKAHIHVRTTIVGASAASVVFVAAAFVLGVRVPLWLGVFALTTTLPIFVEWLRLRAMALDERAAVARGDLLRLVATLFGPVVLSVSTDANVFVVFVNLTYLCTLVYLLVRLPAVSVHLSPLNFWRPASSQLADFAIGQVVSTIPLLVLGGFGPSQYIGGIRLSQTLLGPLNLVFAASTVNLLADGATRHTHAEPAELIRRSRWLAIRLSVLSAALVVILLLLLTSTGFSLRGTDNSSLVIGVALVGTLAVTSGFSGIDAIVMRLLGNHVIPTVGRVLLVVVTGVGYVWGYLAGGTDLSLVCGFIAAAIANPIAFVLPAGVLYRRYTVATDR